MPFDSDDHVETFAVEDDREWNETMAWARRYVPPPPPTKCADCGAGSWQPVCETCSRERARRGGIRYTTLATIPPAFKDVTFEALTRLGWVKDETAVARVLAVLDLDANIVLRGASGMGKTTIAVASLLELAERERRGMFVASTALALARVNRSGFGEPRVIADAVAAPVLVVDDLASDPPHAQSAVGEVIARRYDASKRTIFTTWARDDELRKRYGEGVTRRVLERAKVIEMRPLARAAAPAPGKSNR